jgi:radical SAM superfamily enzyme with C-terminal helix-hairpin-helix motif
MLKILIIDGYIDEPTCLGVPPYISPYPRYIAGGIWKNNKSSNIIYLTIDQIRNSSDNIEIIKKSDLVVVIAGITVPGRYLSGYPVSPNELEKLLFNVSKPLKILTGPAAKYGFGIAGGKKTKDVKFLEGTFDLIIKGDSEIVISNLINNNLKIDTIDSTECRENAESIRDISIFGAKIVKQHPNYPDYIITEIETYRGCPRTFVGGCSFCSEPSKGFPDYRPIENVVSEIKALYDEGIRHIRLGNQPCIFSYMSEEAGKKEFPKPNPDAIEELFKKIRLIAPNLKTFHIDNANPGVIAHFSGLSERIAKTIVKYHTSGDVAAFGVESVDPIVIKKNNLKADSEEVYKAIKLINKVGAKIGANGIPELLPGLNFVFGLIGESKRTFELDYEFLKRVYENNLLIRRINLRQIIPISGTKMFVIGNKINLKNKKHYQKLKRKIKDEIERPMLEKLLPKGTIIKDIYTEKYDGKVTFGRQIGSYPILIGLPGIFVKNKFLNAKVIEYGYRSITAIPYPLNINKATRDSIEAIPGIGKKRAIRILSKRPFKNKIELKNALDEPDLAEKILEFIDF